MIVVVTGANGFIGSHLVDALVACGDEVRRVVRADFASDRFEQIVRGADVVVHAAAATRAPTREGLRASNVALTERALSAARQANVGRFVFISSQAAAGPASARDRPVREDDVPAPVEAYGESKRDAEYLVRASGLPATIVRPAAVYGPRDRDFRALFSLARRGLAIHPGNRAQWISIVHVRDCVAAIIAAMTCAAAVGRTYFVANDEPVQWSTLFALAQRAAGASSRLDVEVPLPLVRLGALFGDAMARMTGQASLLTSEKVALSMAPFWICANDRAKHELGVVPRIPLIDGIAETCQWFSQMSGSSAP
jgi:nucleoside-diphosphate-sugar epimerase